MIHKHWCKSCGDRIEASAGGYCQAEECRSQRNVEIKRQLGVFRAGETREDILKRMDEALTRHPHNGALKIARKAVAEQGFELLSDGVRSSALAQLNYFDSPTAELKSLPQDAFKGVNDYVGAITKKIGEALGVAIDKTAKQHVVDALASTPLPPYTRADAELTNAAYRQMQQQRLPNNFQKVKRAVEALIANRLFDPQLLECWQGVHLDAIASIWGLPQRHLGRLDSYFREELRDHMSKMNVRLLPLSEIRAAVGEVFHYRRYTFDPVQLALALDIHGLDSMTQAQFAQHVERLYTFRAAKFQHSAAVEGGY